MAQIAALLRFRKGDVSGHEFHGNQYSDSVSGVGDPRSYQEAAHVASTMSAIARNSGSDADHRDAAGAHRIAAKESIKNLNTRSMWDTHTRIAEEHETHSPTVRPVSTNISSLASIIAGRTGGSK